MTRETPRGSLQGTKILIVEDEFYLADDLRLALLGADATIIGPVNTVARAWALVEEEQPDFAVLDINLRGEMIFPLANELRRRGVRFVFATGYDAAIIPAQYTDVDRWEKPVDASQIMAAIVSS